MIDQKQLLKQVETYAAKCDQALVDWQNGDPLDTDEVCQIHKGRKYFEVIRGRKGACCHMGYVCKQTGKLYKEQRQKAKWDLLDTNDTDLLFANLCPFGGHLYNTYITKVRGAK